MTAPVLDLDAAQAALDNARAGERDRVSVDLWWMERALLELRAGRAAAEKLGEVFGLGQFKRL